MLALSTAYFTLGDAEVPGAALAASALEFGFGALELDYRLTAAQLRGLRPALARGELLAVSVHHPFPRSPDADPRTAHVERVLLSSPDRDERRAAARRVVETLAHAQDLGVPSVVVHLGEVDLGSEPDPRGLGRLFRQGRRESAEYEALLARVAEARLSEAPRFLDAALSSLDRVAEEALKRGVRLGLENRYHPHQLPAPGELGRIFRELEGAPVGYWHDTGHAAAQAALGLLGSPREALAAFSSRLVGMHLHDAVGIDDHLPPGEGEVDFAGLAPVPPGVPLVLEVHPPVSPEGFAAARAALREAGLLP